MLTINKILFPTDFSECAEHAFAQAARLAEKYKAVLHVLNVVVPRTEDPDNPINYLEERERTELFEASGTYAHDGVVVVHAQETHFSEAVGILEYADRHEVDLIVMGTHGRRGLGRLLMGSVSEEVVRRSSGPVVTVSTTTDCGARKPIRNVLAPIDFSESSQAALTYAKELAAAYEGRLHVLHVISEVALPGVYGVETVSVVGPDVQARVREAMKEEVEACPGAEAPFDVHVLVGYPTRDIADFARQHDIDLIVLATHGRTGLKRLVMGSVAENVVRLAPCPVFALKSFGRSLLRSSAAQVEQGT